MTKDEILKRIDEIETRRFYLAMIDRWTTREYDTDTELANELYSLKTTIMEMN